MAGYSKIINFIKDLYGNQEFTPLAVPKFIGNEKKYLEECIDTTFVSSVGKLLIVLRMIWLATLDVACSCLCKWYQCPPHGAYALGRGA